MKYRLAVLAAVVMVAVLKQTQGQKTVTQTRAAAVVDLVTYILLQHTLPAVPAS